MFGLSRRYLGLSAAILLMNAAGIVWIRADVVGASLLHDDCGPPEQMPSGPLTIVNAQPSWCADQADRFALEFDDDVVGDDRVGEALLDPPFTVNPKPEGYWRWSSSRRIEYVITKRLLLGRAYVVEASEDHAEKLGRELTGETRFEFKTSPLRVNHCRVRSFDADHVSFEILFNQPVAGDDVCKHLEITSFRRGDGAKIECLNAAPSATVTVRTDRRNASRIKVRVREGLKGHGADLPLASAYDCLLEIAPAFSLLHAYAPQPSINADATVEISFSAELDPSCETPGVEISPDVGRVSVSRGYRGLRLTGPFESGTRYTVRLKGIILSKDGQTLHESERVRFTVPQRQPTVKFARREGILMPGGNLALKLDTVNIPGVDLNAWRVHANNIVAHAQGQQQRFTSRPVVQRRVHIAAQQNHPKELALDLASLLAEPMGAYRIEAVSIGSAWQRDTCLVVVSDLGITVKEERKRLMAWITSLNSSIPLEGVRVRAYSFSNQELSTAVTDSSGVACLDVKPDDPNGPVWLVSAERGADLNYIVPDANRWLVEDADTSGRSVPTTYDSMLYTERGVYRPGDAVHITGIVRNATGATPPPFPLMVVARRPDGKVCAELAAKPDEVQGMFHVDFVTRDDAPTGKYSFDATLPGAEESLGSTSALVEAFVPIRIEVEARTSSEKYLPEDEAKLCVSSRYLFGKPAVGLPVRVSGSLKRVAFESKAYPAYRFIPPDLGTSRSMKQLTGRLDDEGVALFDLAAAHPSASGLWKADMAATVSETGGRSVSANTSAVFDTSLRHVGLRVSGAEVVSTGEPLQVAWIVVDGNDEPAAPGEVSLTLDRVEHDYYWQQVNGHYTWKCAEQLIRVDERKSAQASGEAELNCAANGRYRLCAVDLKSGSAAQVEFYASSYADGSPCTSDRPNKVEVVLDRTEYLPGETAKAIVRSPFAGSLLVTLETDVVLSRHVVSTDGETTVSLAVPSELRGGAYVTATVVRPIDPNSVDWTPRRAFGVTRLVTNHAPRRRALNLIAQKTARPGETVTVEVESFGDWAGGRAPLLHVWAVDEGILIPTGYVTPDPHRHFFAMRELVTTTSDVFDRLLPDTLLPVDMQRIGAGGPRKGDISKALATRRSLVSCRKRHPAVVWSAAKAADADGVTTFSLGMPEMTGRMRVMAVVVDGDRYGAGQVSVTLNSPLGIEASWPRFAAPGDEFRVPVKVFNNTDSDLTVDLEIDGRGPVHVSGGATLHGVHVARNTHHLAWLSAAATGIGEFTCSVTARTRGGMPGELDVCTRVSIPIRPAAPPQSKTRFLRLDAGATHEIEPLSGFHPGSVKTVVTISSDALAEVLPAVQALIRYPYGCVEQTSSRLYPMIYAPHLLAAEGVSLGQQTDRRVYRVTDMIESGLERLESMQTPSGGIGYWPGASEPHVWGTGYASFLLLQAKQAGYYVDERFTSSLSSYLEESLKASVDDDLDYNTRALFCHVLSGFGKPNHGWMARLSELVGELDIAGRANLAGAWHLAGRADRAAQVLTTDTLDLTVVQTTGGRITSRVRQEALLLLVLMEIDPQHAWVPRLVARLRDARREGRWGNTIENASALAALARYQATAKTDAEFKGSARLPGGTTLEFDSKRTATLEFRETGNPAVITSSGTGTVIVSLLSEGLPLDPNLPSYDRKLVVRRKWTDDGGRPIDRNGLRVGDLVRVEVEVSAPLTRPYDLIHNVAILDLLPAGMEVENPRLGTSAGFASTDACAPDHVQFLDDRVVLFTSAGNAPRRFNYALRATTQGLFILPPIQASCMYDAEIASMHGGGGVSIGRWEDAVEAPRATPELAVIEVTR